MSQSADRGFHGAKLALFLGPQLVVIRRDVRPDIPWPGALDLPGGGREGEESPADCVIRETREELGLRIGIADLVWARSYRRGGDRFWFFAAHLPAAAARGIVFGDEGQGWWLMSPGAYVTHPEAVPHFRDRLRDYLIGCA